ncbi:glycosyltransferase family 2 protein [Desertivirga xinjiangensis]|uniref:glycosyltransferase family 2 protein n=1 Tax=Desertivirga xinjiangensis TaxID=539206 RepID=UPI002108BDE6|nr:glycosyltransferase family 2 protein [Pedobacter xinjiangensis]
MPKISVIIPAYNAKNYISRCISSILGQSFKDFELILIDDGSTDSTLEICKKFAAEDSRIRVENQMNLGVSAARNKGISLSRGQYVSFVDADDYLECTFLENFKMDVFQDRDFYIQGMRFVDGENVSRSPVGDIGEIESLKSFILVADKKHLFEGPCAKLFKTELVKANKVFFDQSLSFGEDNLFILNYLKYIESFCITPFTDYNYILHHNQASLSTKVHDFDKILKYIQLTHAERMSIQKRISSDEYLVFLNKVNNRRLFTSILGVFSNIRKLSAKDKLLRFRELLDLIDFKFGIDSESSKLVYLFRILAVTMRFPRLSYFVLSNLIKLR